MEAPVPGIEPLRTALTPSALPRVLNDQALRAHIFLPKEEDQVNQGPATNPELNTTNEFVALTEVDHRARHMAQSGLDQCSLIEHSDRWNKVDTQAKRTPPDDDDQPPLKQIVATNIGKKCSFAF